VLARREKYKMRRGKEQTENNKLEKKKNSEQ
jgi:hypothetical protein